MVKIRIPFTLVLTISIGLLYFIPAENGYSFEPKLDSQIQANVNQLLETRRCRKCQLQRADLRGKDLSYVDLQGADLSFANLESTSLRGANLNSTLLFGTNLINANLKRTNLSFTCLSGAIFNNANLEGANLANSYMLKLNPAIAIQAVQWERLNTPIKLSAMQPRPDTPKILNAWLLPAKCDFWYRNSLAGKEKVELAPTKYTNAKLHKVSLRNVDLSGADLRGVDLQGTDLRDANITGTNFGEANLAYANLSGVRSKGTNFMGANLARANLSYVQFSFVSLKNSNLSRAYLFGAVIEFNLGIDEVKLSDPSVNLCGAIMPDGKRSVQGCK